MIDPQQNQDGGHPGNQNDQNVANDQNDKGKDNQNDKGNDSQNDKGNDSQNDKGNDSDNVFESLKTEESDECECSCECAGIKMETDCRCGISLLNIMGFFGKLLLVFWELPGIAFIFGFYLNSFVLFSCDVITQAVDKHYCECIICAIPTVILMLFVTNILLICIREYGLTIIDSITNSRPTFWATSQELAFKLLKVTEWKCCFDLERLPKPFFFEAKHLKPAAMSTFSIVFLIMIGCLISPKTSIAMGRFISFFAFWLPTIKYGLIVVLYALHSWAAFSKSKCHKYLELEHDDPLLNAIYLRKYMYNESPPICCCCGCEECSCRGKQKGCKKCDCFCFPDGKQCTTKKECYDKTHWRLWKLISIVALIILMTFYFKFGKGFRWSMLLLWLIPFCLIIFPLMVHLDLPFYFWQFLTQKEVTQSEIHDLKAEITPLLDDSKYEKASEWSDKSISWSPENQLICGASILIYAIIIIFFVLALILSATINIKPKSTGETFTRTTQMHGLDLPDFGEIESPICQLRTKGLTADQLCALAAIAYMTDVGPNGKDEKDYKQLLNEYFKGYKVESMETGFKNDGKTAFLQHLRIAELDLHVFAIRGTTAHHLDKVADVDLLFSSALLSVMSNFAFFATAYSPQWVKIMGKSTSFFRGTLKSFSVSSRYLNDLYGYIDSVMLTKDEDALIVGHSLGGGLAKVVSLKTNYQCVSISGPGITALASHYGDADADLLMRTFVDIVPDQDLVTMFDVVQNTKFNIPCNKGLVSCHSLSRTICQINAMCNNGHRNFCYDYYGFGDTSQSDMLEMGSSLKIHTKKNRTKT